MVSNPYIPAIELLGTAAESSTTSSSSDGSRTRSQRLKILDLDETLVCAYETASLPAALRNQAIEAGLNWFELECLSSDEECDGKAKRSIMSRSLSDPDCNDFLEQLSQFADLVLFTAGPEGYARPLVDRIDTRKVLTAQQPTLSTFNS